jgi:dUTPase
MGVASLRKGPLFSSIRKPGQWTSAASTASRTTIKRRGKRLKIISPLDPAINMEASPVDLTTSPRSPSPPCSPPPPATYQIRKKSIAYKDESPIFTLRAMEFVEFPPHSTKTIDTGVIFDLPPFVLALISAPEDPLEELKVWNTMWTNLNKETIKLQFTNISGRERAILRGDIMAQIAFTSAINIHEVKITDNAEIGASTNTTLPPPETVGLSSGPTDNSDHSSDSGMGDCLYISCGPPEVKKRKMNRPSCTRCSPYLNATTGRMIFRAHGPHGRGCPERRREADRTWRPPTNRRL